MRAASRLLLLALAPVLACSPTKAATDDSAAAAPKVDYAAEEKAIRDLDAQWANAVAAKDTAAISKLYATDALFMPPNMQALGGRAGAQKGWGGMFSMLGFGLTFGPTKIVVAQSGDMAYDIGTYTFTMQGAKGPVEDKGKYLVVWKKQDGQWKVVADMFNSDGAPSK
jgi:uncharacterized protein (TIGR02246 family)